MTDAVMVDPTPRLQQILAKHVYPHLQLSDLQALRQLCTALAESVNGAALSTWRAVVRYALLQRSQHS